ADDDAALERAAAPDVVAGHLQGELLTGDEEPAADAHGTAYLVHRRPRAFVVAGAVGSDPVRGDVAGQAGLVDLGLQGERGGRVRVELPHPVDGLSGLAVALPTLPAGRVGQAPRVEPGSAGQPGRVGWRDRAQ